MNMGSLWALLNRRILQTLLNSYRGLSAVWKTEEAFRIELIGLLLLTPIAVLVANDYVQLILLLGSITLVLIVELLNTCVEIVVDRISLDFHDLSGRAKDVGSAAVLVSLLLAGGIWALVLAHNYASMMGSD
jgi:diacylglycerol kinase (ATP)|tara:strand:+ start:4136 stop:4531 length:396 start_codon:yes stop_codon:yes gene_type:complete